MPEELRLEISASDSAGQAVCPLCGGLADLLGTAVLLYEGPTPLGYLCQECLLTGPRAAAVKIRARAEQLRVLANQAPAHLSVDQWPAVVQTAQKRVAYWDSLADRLAALEIWKAGRPGSRQTHKRLRFGVRTGFRVKTAEKVSTREKVAKPSSADALTPTPVTASAETAGVTPSVLL